MRRLAITTLTLLLLATTASWAWAASAPAGAGDAEGPAAAPFSLPATPPAADAAHPGTYGYATSSELGDALRADAPAPAPAAASAGAGTSVTVTAVVLPVVTIVRDGDEIVEIIANTPDRGSRDALFTVRDGATDGPAGELDAATWAQARAALAEAAAGTGTIWER